jgi:hypothetical protein
MFDGQGWNLFVTKLIDNAGTGFNKYFRNLVLSFPEEAMDDIL